MTASQKSRLYDQLLHIGFKEIEVGFPAASSHDYDFVRKLIDEDRIPEDVTIQVLTQARADLIEKTFTALKGVRRAIVHVYNSTSTVQREQVFGLDRKGITAIAVEGARLVREYASQYPDRANDKSGAPTINRRFAEQYFFCNNFKHAGSYPDLRYRGRASLLLGSTK